jgi:hypothetical protein
MTAETGYIPSELELLVKQELRKTQEVPDALMIQIFRAEGGTWRAEARFKTSNRTLLGDYKANIATKVAEIGARLALSHRLVG